MKRTFFAILIFLFLIIVSPQHVLATQGECETNDHPAYKCTFATSCSDSLDNVGNPLVPATNDQGEVIMCGDFIGDGENYPCCMPDTGVVEFQVDAAVCTSTYDGFCSTQRTCQQDTTQAKNSSNQSVFCKPSNGGTANACCRYDNITGTDNLCRAGGGTCLQATPTYEYTVLTPTPPCTQNTNVNDPYCNLCSHANQVCYKQSASYFCGEGPFHNSAQYREENDYACYPSACPTGHRQWDDSDGELRPCPNGGEVCCTDYDTTGREQVYDETDPFCTHKNPNSGIRTAFGCIKFTGASAGQDLITTILKIATGVGGGIALMLILYGVFAITTSAGNPDKIKAGKEVITSATIGLVFIILSVFLINLIGVNILGIPGLS